MWLKVRLASAANGVHLVGIRVAVFTIVASCVLAGCSLEGEIVLQQPHVVAVDGVAGACVINNLMPRPPGVLTNFYRLDEPGGNRARLNDVALDTDGYSDSRPAGWQGWYVIEWVSPDGWSSESEVVSATSSQDASATPRKEWSFKLNDLSSGVIGANVEHGIVLGGFVYPTANGFRYKVDAENGRIDRVYETTPWEVWTMECGSVTSCVAAQIGGRTVLVDISYPQLYADKTFLTCMDESSGEVIWRRELPIRVASEGIACDGRNVLLANSEGLDSYSLADGSLVWKLEGYHFTYTTPLLDLETRQAYVVTSDIPAKAIRVDIDTGKVTGSLSMGANWGHYASPLRVDDLHGDYVIFIGSQGTVFKASPYDFYSWIDTWTVPATDLWDDGVVIGGSATYYDGDLTIQTGAAKIYCLSIMDFGVRWEYTPPEHETVFNSFWTSGLVDEFWYYQPTHRAPGWPDTCPSENGLMVLDRMTGERLAYVAPMHWSSSCFVPLYALGVVVTGEAYSVDYPEKSGHLVGYRVREGVSTGPDYPTYRGNRSRTGFYESGL